MKVFLTGGSGFLGHHIIPRLKEKGHQVLAPRSKEVNLMDAAQVLDFLKKEKVPLHGSDFDYVDAASQSNSLLWMSNETNWQNVQYRRRIQATFQVEIRNVNEYMNSVGTQGAAGAS